MFGIAMETVNLPPIDESTIRHMLAGVSLPWWRRFSYRLLAARCVFCNRRGDLGDIDLCESCLWGLPWSSGPASISSLFEYRPPISTALIALKFHADFRYASVLGTLLGLVWRAKGFGPPAERSMAIVPVPLHLSRLQARGFNQVTQIARYAHEIIGWPLFEDGLSRARPTLAQTRLDAAARRSNLQQAFRLGLNEPYPSTAFVLLDDVATTGATMEAAVATLQTAGEVYPWAVARAMPANITSPMV